MSFPSELHALVIAFADKKTLLTLRQVNHALSSLVAPTLFHSFRIKDAENLAELQSSDVAQIVRVLDYEASLCSDEAICAPLSQLDKFPSLEVLVLKLRLKIKYDGWDAVLQNAYDERKLQSAILAAIACSSLPPRLTTLILDKDLGPNEADFVDEAVGPLWDHIQHLTISALSNSYYTPSIRNFWGESIGRGMLSQLKTLTSLTLASNQSADFLEFSTAPGVTVPTFPCITHMTVFNILLSTVDDLEELIFAQSQTLQHLHLVSCDILVDEESPIPMRTWAPVWSRLQTEMPQLQSVSNQYPAKRQQDTDYEVVVLHDTSGLYLWFLLGRGFFPREEMFEDDPAYENILENDKIAFQQLQIILENRRNRTSE